VFRLSTLRGSLPLAVAIALTPVWLGVKAAVAQDDSNEAPLGDIARNLRKNKPPAQEVIDNDNLSTVMDQADSKHTSSPTLKFVMAGGSKDFQVAAPEATCSLSFTANTKALLSEQYAQMDLPAAELPKLTGPAAIEGDALTVSIFNGTDWHVSEIAVAFTIVKKDTAATPLSDPIAQGGNSPQPFQIPQYNSGMDEVRPVKQPDRTVIYHMRAAASPLTTTVFSAQLNPDPAAGQEWHWAIVGARGYPPQNRMGEAQKTSAADVRGFDPRSGQTGDQKISLSSSPAALPPRQ
jgi:hypothetical protein